MSQQDDFDRSIARWLETEARPAATADVLDRALEVTRGRHRRPRPYAIIGSHWVGDATASSGAGMRWPVGALASTALVVLLLVLVVTAGVAVVGVRISQPGPVDLGVFAPVAGRIVYGDEKGILGIDPAAPADPATSIQLTGGVGIPLAWSSDGNQLLIARGRGTEVRLFVVHADGSETQVMAESWDIRGATLSPDGSRVVFAGVDSDLGSALYAVDAAGGPARRLVGEAPGEGLLQQPAFSADGKQIAYVLGSGDHGNSVWLIDADGSGPRRIVSNESDALPGHVRGLAWSPAGDRIALGLGGWIYTFAPDGSDLTQITGSSTTCGDANPCSAVLPSSAESPYWSPDGSRISYTTGCTNGAGAADRTGCHVAIVDAYGSRSAPILGPQTSMSGPWHPAPVTSAAP